MNTDEIEKIRQQFPILVNNPQAVYLDSAATALKPQIVIDALDAYYKEHTANVSRGAYQWATVTTRLVTDARKKVASFIHANNTDEIVFTSGTTQSMNTIAYSWGLHNLKNGDEIIVGRDDHKSTVAPWYNLQKILAKWNISIHIKTIGYTSSGTYQIDELQTALSNKTRLICITHVHNVYGVEMELSNIRKIVPASVLIALDAAQSIGHTMVDVQRLDVDFISFSGHKMFADTGIGVLWINKSIHSQMQPFMVGGETELKQAVYQRLEAGTPHIAGIIGLHKAIDFISTIGLDVLHNHLVELTQYAITQLKQLDRIVLLPGYAHSQYADGYGIVAFQVKGISSSDVGFILDEYNVFVRTGTHCRSGTTTGEDSVRISMHIYNTQEEIDIFISALKTILKTL